MNEPMSSERFSEIENKLDALYNAASPSPAFANRLAIQLAQTYTPMPTQSWSPKRALRGGLGGFFSRPAWAIALTAVVLLVVAISLIGPRQVLAEVQRWFGYAPGAGFIEAGQTRILAAPVEVTQAGVTLRVEQVTANSQQTQVTLLVSGLPREKFDPRSAAGDAPQEAKPYLLLPDGVRLAPSGSISGIGEVLQASLTFPPIPQDVDRITLVLPRLPSLPAGFAPENWSIELTLQTTQVSGTSSPAGLPLTQPYTPENATASASGVNLQLLQVAQNPQETGLEVGFTWDNPAWVSLASAQMQLSDETGRSYNRHLAPLGPAFEPGGSSTRGSRTMTYRFDPLSAQAKTGRLTVDTLTFRFSSQAQFAFDPGRDVSDGQTWDLSPLPGSHLNLAGMPVQLLSLSVKTNPNQAASAEDRYLLELLVQAPPQDGLAVDNLSLSLAPDRGMSGSCEWLPGTQFKLTVGMAELPRGPLHLYFRDGELSLTGPWTIEWKLPGQSGPP